MRMLSTQRFQKPLRGMALAIVLRLTVLPDDRFRCQRDHGPAVRMHDRTGQQLMVVGDRAVAVTPLAAGLAAHGTRPTWYSRRRLPRTRPSNRAPRGPTAATTGTSDRTPPQPTSNSRPDDQCGPAARLPSVQNTADLISAVPQHSIACASLVEASFPP